ncbi:Golgin subfamily A member 7/ERF4 family-domain-containing protein [Aspergillus taichungensis]|uniref:Ras modification protein ERF4 n=1 Tax=Aspergillus taichungensis TaxID=482145 RepID=A0A2J5HCK3_9EURO|nr:Golgin subfamily A member 7/ERF4 family-domain-containing protein [Aspergillus taichungensis]
MVRSGQASPPSPSFASSVGSSPSPSFTTAFPDSPSHFAHFDPLSPLSEAASLSSASNQDHQRVRPRPETAEASCSHLPPRGTRQSRRRSIECYSVSSSSRTSLRDPYIPRRKKPWVSSSPILRPPAVRLANPVNYVPRITPVIVPTHAPFDISNEDLPLESHRDAHPLLSIPERRRSRFTPSPNSLVVERSQGETESGRSSIALPRRQRRHSGAFVPDDRWAPEEMSAPHAMSQDTQGLRPPDRAHLGAEFPAGPPGPPLEDRPRHVASQASLRSMNAPIASIPSHTGAVGEADVAEELAWGPAHPCFPHFNPHVPIGSQEYETTRIIRIRRDWMIKGDLAPTFSNLYPEILDPLVPDQEFRRIIATVNDALIQAFDPFSLRNWVDGVVGLLTGWVWEDLGAPAVKSHLQRVEDWLEKWNREVGEKDGVHIWSLRRSAYMSLDIQIPDPKVGIIPTQSIASRPGSAV